ncbi:MAG: hypothetical protein WBP93_13445 [Pyrinomonadaceae bacterium]
MNTDNHSYLTKLAWSLPWLARYPVWRAKEFVRRLTQESGTQHLIVLVANHFEPFWSESGEKLDLPMQQRRLEDWCAMAEETGRAVRDADGKPFCHTMFYPGEEYHAPLLDRMAQLQRDGFGEVEIHLHHGCERADTAANLRRALVEFRDALAEEHKCLSRMNGAGVPMYGFVHGNLALGNSAGGRWCGVDEEMQILAETGCYADFTLPSAPDQSQMPRLNTIYQCGHPLDEARPHRSGPSIRVGSTDVQLPLIFTGPLVFDWRRRVRGLPVPKLDCGALASNYEVDLERFHKWRGANIHVKGRPRWVFIKLYSHGFYTEDQSIMIGEGARRFWGKVLELSEQTGDFRLHFVTAREAFNIVMAAAEGREGEPGAYLDYRLQTIMRAESEKTERAKLDEEDAIEPFARALN